MQTLVHVENDDAKAVVFTAALEEAKLEVVISRVSDGEQAIRFLHGLCPYLEVRRPDVVFLDINMPKRNGWQVLEEMRADKDGLQFIPVVVLSSSSRQVDRERAYSLGALHYMVKPMSFGEWVAQVEFAYAKFPGVAAIRVCETRSS